MMSFIKKVSNFIKRKCWYLVLLTVSSGYVWYYRFDIYQLKELNVHNLIFIVWILLLLMPLFSEMEFFGVKVKKEVEKATEEVRRSLQNLQTQITQLQMTNSVANSVNFWNTPLPSGQKLEELLQNVREMQQSNAGINSQQKDTISADENKNIYLFKVRLEIETTLYELCEKIGYPDKMPIMKMVQLLNSAEILSGTTCDLINQVCKIANRGVHGEIMSREYVSFVEETYPEIMRQLKDASERLKYITCPRCRYSGYSAYENICPRCGYTYDDD